MKEYNPILGALFSGKGGEGGYNAGFRQSRLAALYQNDDPEKQSLAAKQLAAVDPESAGKWQQEQAKVAQQNLERKARMLASAPSLEVKQQLYSSIVPEVRKVWADAPDVYTPELDQMLTSWAGADGGKPKARSSHILADGTIAFMDEYGNLTKTGEKASNTYGFQTDAEGNVYAQDRRGGTVAPAPMGSVQQGMPQVQAGADPMAGGLDRINQGVQVLKSNGVPVEKINEWADNEFAKLQGSVQQGVVEQAPAQAQPSQAKVAVKTEAPKPKEAPSGYAYKPDGSLAPIPGGPADPANKAADAGKLTDDMRKTSTLLSRMDFALNQIRDVEKSDKSANRPGYGVAAIDYLPDALGNDLKSSGRQQIEAAQLDALDAALTLATGAAYTKEQLFGLRKAYFPQPNDSEATIKAKQARFENVIQSARVRAGNAAQTSIKPTGGANGAPKVGDVVKGYQYLGGNPADPKSWKKQ